MNGKRILALLTVFLTAAGLFAQQADSQEKELTIEEIYLRNMAVQLIQEQANDNNHLSKVEALEGIENLMNTGRVSGYDPDVFNVLDSLANEGVGKVTRENGRMINYFPDIRLKSATLLGRMGGEESKEALVDMVMKDPDPSVMAEAALSLGKIGLNSNNEVTSALAFSVKSLTKTQPDEKFAYNVLIAFEQLAQANNGITDPEVFSALITIRNGNYPRTVKNKAKQIIDQFKNF